MLIDLLDEHLAEGWSAISFPAKINMSSANFKIKKISVPEFDKYYLSKENKNLGRPRSSFINN